MAVSKNRFLILVCASIVLSGSHARGQEASEEASQLPAVVVEGSAEPAKPKSKKKRASSTDTRLTGVEGAGITNDAVSEAASGAAPGKVSGDAESTLAGGGSVTGASTSVISREQIERSPQATLADILSREAGVQTSSFYGGVNGAGTTVDLRGFGVTGPSNTLILINGRRLNDWDLPGFDLSTIARDSIERIEITRGNSGAVLYGDGAVGGVINIVTRAGVDAPNQARIEGGFGSFQTREGTISASGSSGVFSAFVNGNVIESDGYRDNNELSQTSAVGDFRWTFAQGSIYVNVAADDQNLGLPGPRDLIQLREDPRGTDTPFDYAEKQGARVTLGTTYTIAPNFELIVDGGLRTKEQQSGFFFKDFFSERESGAYLDTNLTTKSFTPRMDITRPFLGLPSRVLAGIDVFDTDYESNRSQFKGQAPIHIYNGGQTTVGGYWQQTVSVLPTTDVAAGGRIQWNETTARDILDPTAPSPTFVNPEGLPLNQSETNQAWHLGVEHQLLPGFTLLARAAQSFRVPNIDERIGASPIGFVTDFGLKTQTSHDWEAGVRAQSGAFSIQSTYYEMYLTDELRFDPISFANTNLDPTRRRGIETIASWQLTPDVRLRGNLTYTNAEFREGPFAGNQVPMVSPWTANAGLSWNILGPQLWFDANLRYFSQRYLDGDEINEGRYFVPSTTLVDMKIGGEADRLFWSAAVQNVFDEEYYDYGLDQGFGLYSFYPLAGRTFMLKAGATW